MTFSIDNPRGVATTHLRKICLVKTLRRTRVKLLLIAEYLTCDIFATWFEEPLSEDYVVLLIIILELKIIQKSMSETLVVGSVFFWIMMEFHHVGVKGHLEVKISNVGLGSVFHGKIHDVDHDSGI